MVYLVSEDYLENAAETNRLFAFVRAMVVSGIDVSVVYINHCPLKTVHGAQVVSLLQGKAYPRLFEKLSAPSRLSRFAKRLTSDDSLVFMTTTAAMFPVAFSHNRRFSVFHEKTEKPGITRPDTFVYRLFWRIYYPACRRLDGLFVISQSLRTHFIDKGVESSKIHIVNMVVDPDRFNGVSKAPSYRYVAFCGTLSNKKDGVDLLIKAFSSVVCKDDSIKLVLLGKYNDKSDSLVNEELIHSLGLTNHVELLGDVSYEQVPHILKNAEVLALARPMSIQAQFGFPTKVGEYLLTGNPVVLTDVGDIPLFLKDGENALVARAGDVKGFADRLIFALNNKAQAERIGTAGYQTALKFFNCQIETKKILDAIKSAR